MSRTALIDGDIIVYSCGFASDAAARANGMSSEPLGYCLNGVNETVKAVMEHAGCGEVKVWLTSRGTGGYRDEAFPDYKANRSGEKPFWYEAIREHLIKKWGAQVSSDGREADDELGIDLVAYDEESPGSAVLCSKDKDLDMIPGLHYNWSKTKKDKGVYMVTDVEADRTFYKQMLQGDSTDNIPGMFKAVGVKATQKWLDPIDSMTEPAEMFSYVREVYMTLGKDLADKHGGAGTVIIAGRNLATTEGCEAFLLLLGTLLWIQRKEGGLWIPPTGGFHALMTNSGGADAVIEKPKKTIKPKASAGSC